MLLFLFTAYTLSDPGPWWVPISGQQVTLITTSDFLFRGHLGFIGHHVIWPSPIKDILRQWKLINQCLSLNNVGLGWYWLLSWPLYTLILLIEVTQIFFDTVIKIFERIFGAKVFRYPYLRFWYLAIILNRGIPII